MSIKQMKNSEAKARKVVVLNDLRVGFFRIERDSGNIFYTAEDRGQKKIHPVLENGLLSRAIVQIDFTQKVEVVEKSELKNVIFRYAD